MSNTAEAAPGAGEKPVDFLTAVEGLLMKALQAISDVLGDEQAPAATRVRAAFGVIDLIYGRSGSRPKQGELAETAAALAHRGPGRRPGESVKDYYARQRREQALARAGG